MAQRWVVARHRCSRGADERWGRLADRPSLVLHHLALARLNTITRIRVRARRTDFDFVIRALAGLRVALTGTRVANGWVVAEDRSPPRTCSILTDLSAVTRVAVRTTRSVHRVRIIAHARRRITRARGLARRGIVAGDGRSGRTNERRWNAAAGDAVELRGLTGFGAVTEIAVRARCPDRNCVVAAVPGDRIALTRSRVTGGRRIAENGCAGNTCGCDSARVGVRRLTYFVPVTRISV